MVAIHNSTHAASLFSRAQLLELIMSLNPTATAVFLSQFTDNRLRGYLDHLTAVQQPRGRDARWQRPAETPAILSKEASE